MQSKPSGTVASQDPQPRRFPSAGLHFMNSVFRKTENISFQRRLNELTRAPQGSPQKLVVRPNLPKKQPPVLVREGRVNSCGKSPADLTPNSKSFEDGQQWATSPDFAKHTFLLNQKRLKTILGKNTLDVPPKNGVPTPEVGQPSPHPVAKHPSKVSSARTSPQINKLRSPLLMKGVSRDKSKLLTGTEGSFGYATFKPFQKSIVTDLKNSRAKLFTKLTTKFNKENAKNDDNAPVCPVPASHPELEATIAQDWTKVRQISQKNCIFANFLGTNFATAKDNLKHEDLGHVFRKTLAEKFCCDTFDAHCGIVVGLKPVFDGATVSLDAAIDSFVKTVRHPSILQLSADLRTDNDTAKAIDRFVKLEVFFMLFVLPIAHSSRLKSAVSLFHAFEAICWNLGCMGRMMRDHFRNVGKLILSESLQTILKARGLAGSDKAAAKAGLGMAENNAFLKSCFKTFVGELKPVSLRKTLTGLIAKIGEGDISQFVSAALDAFLPFFERFQEVTMPAEPDVVTGDPPSASLSSTSYVYEDEDPYFILQPLKIEKYLPDKAPQEKPYTLVLDLDETLVHFTETENKGKFLVRPFAREFLLKLQAHYEIVVFTAALKDYADWILDRIDTGRSIRYRLYRDHTTFQNGVYLKDLSRLNRDLSKTIIVDNNPDNFQMHPENGIYIKSWYEDPNDLALKHLTGVLVRIAESQETDIRKALATHNRRLIGGREGPEVPGAH